MSSYLAELRTVATSIHTLLTAPGDLDPSEIELALAGHSALVELLRQVTDDIVRWGFISEPVDVSPTLDRHPAAMLQRLLQQHTQIRTEQVSTLLKKSPVTAKGQAWQDLLTAASGAESFWRTMPRSLKPVGDELWSHLAEVAPIAEALTRLDLDLADNLTAQQRRPDADKLRTSSRSNLAIAAREVAYHAAGGELPQLQERGPESVRVMARLAPTDLPEALFRMGHRFASGGPISTEAIMAAVVGAAMSAEAIAATLNAAGLESTADRLTQLAKDLKEVQKLRTRVASPVKTTPHSAEQARQIQQLLLRMNQNKEKLPLLDALAAGKQLPVTLAHLRDTVEEQFRTNQWYVRRQVKGKMGWGPTTSRATPTFLRHLTDVVTSTEPLSHVLSSAQPSTKPPAAPTPREIVRQALSLRGPPPRPGLPSLARYRYRNHP